MKPILIVCLFFFCASPLSAQQNLLKLIAEKSNQGITIKGNAPENKFLSLPKELECGSANHNYLVKDGKLFTLVDGSGKVYLSDSSNINRIDNTCFEGYNFGAYTFVWKNKIYSLGGWGFWKTNGGLRYYDEKAKEWFIVRLNEEIEFSQIRNSLVCPDLQNNRIYLAYLEANDVYAITPKEKEDKRYRVQCLNLETASWWKEPKFLSSDIRSEYLTDHRQIIPTKYGLIMEGVGDFWGLFDFNSNTVFKLNAEKAALLGANEIKNKKGFYISYDSTLYLYNPLTDSLGYIELKSTDFTPTDLHLYNDEPFSISNWVNKLKYYFILSAIFLLIIFFMRKRKSIDFPEAQTQEKNKTLEVDKTSPFLSALNEQERSVLEIILNNSSSGNYTTIDQINHALGAKNKDATIQNKLRSDCLQMINKKFGVYASTNDALVERERTEFDKRVYQYQINKRYLKKLK
jgi:hypothetical protein